MNAGRAGAARPSFPGPVFGRELGSAARGGRLYLVRALSAAALAAFVGSSVGRGGVLSGSGTVSQGQVALLATRAFESFADAQLVLVLAMVPVLAAGALAGEQARGTLDLLLSSGISSAGIVADKLAARMLLVLVPMIAALPVLALIGMLGGVDPGRLAMSYAVTLSAAWFAAALSMLVSVHSRTAAGAIVGAYAAGLAWVVLPVWSAAWLGRCGWPALVAWAGPVAREVARSSPLSIRFPVEAWGRRAMMPGMWSRMIGEMAALQVAGGVVLFALAATRLRPAYRARMDARPGRRWGWLGRVAGLRGGPRPACGDDPIAWKERHAPESAALARLAILVPLALVAHATVNDVRWNMAHRDLAFDELFRHGLDPGPWGIHGHARHGMNYVLCEKAALLYFAAMTAVAVLAASGVAGERARGTWESLLATPLDRASILRAKVRGAVWAVRVPLGMALSFYLASLATTAMHPVGLVLGVAAVASFVWFAAAMGTYVSLRSRDAAQAIGRTALILAAVDLAPAALLFPFVGGSALMATTPMLATVLPMSRMTAHAFAEGVWIDQSVVLAIAIALGIVLAHAVGAWVLTRATARSRDLSP